MSPILNALSVDVEDYFQVSAFSDVIPPGSWERFDGRVERNTLHLLDLFDHRQAKATFFVLGWIAERYPQLVHEIHLRGHEVASHGHAHRPLDQLTPHAFREEVRGAKAVLEALIGEPVFGYRAPSFSITRKTRWALDILCEEGFRYDSSIFPIHHDRYGIPDAPRFPHVIELPGGTLSEFPPSTVALIGRTNLPIGGGGYLRLLPFWMTQWGLRRINRRERQPAMVYLHPWEIDPEQPRIHARWFSRWRHYTNLDTTVHRLDHLLREFQFGAIRTVLGLAGHRFDLARPAFLDEAGRHARTPGGGA
jgi:polysaccharide deacetylase family protein (PEP-CTERM system associated)